MNYLFFVSFNTGLLHNACHTTLEAIRESVVQLINDENTKLENGTLPSVNELKNT